MCGIYGIANRDAGVDKYSLIRRGDVLKHRGPDDAGLWMSPDGQVALGHRRLAVIDLSPAGHQPMVSEDGRHVVAFNGEIYNFCELKRELQQQGYHFSTDSDTEVMLVAYRAWGESCLSRFNGMFAFVIYDQGSDVSPPSLFFARDRAGEKPLYYVHTNSTFQFASELKALDHSKQINLQSLNHYLSLGYIPANMCLFEGVQKLPAAHCGRLNLQTGELKILRYWELPKNRLGSEFDGVQLTLKAGELIEDSVRLRLVADVPVGVLLSGGLDSSLVTAAAARVSSAPVETFTIALPGSSLDEAHHAQKVASYFGTRHHVLPLGKPSLDLLDGLAPFIDEPIADSSILPAWLVFGLARKHVTVALGGDGGDELFGGYSDYTTSLADARRWGWVPQHLFQAAAAAAANLPAGVRGRNRIASLRGGPFQQLIWGRPYFDSRLRRRLLKTDATAELGAGLEAPEHFLRDLFHQGSDPLDSMTRTHFGSILPDDFLVKVDRASMAHSLEVRAPFLDHRLIEFAFGQVPSDWKVQGNESRRLQRLLARQWLPPDLDINRKQGFSIPINEWLRNDGEQGLMARMEGLPDVINLDEVHRLVLGHISGRANGGRLFALIMLAIAMRNIYP
ncbi:MAG: asparagine synthase (glutamine-hydrolyzing) [Burkholderiales bacterium RIFCSPLOWO2_12_FULL_61_40]|nr:MAG: asparagine synthase (glutamine-hydrolyzing) [Burkholderiales bacterium RIFCSPLOWO2_12_FULL_61_40]